MTLEPNKPATADGIRRILGDLDDETVASIIRTGATEAEIVEAFQWASADDELGADVERSRSGVVGAIYEILKSEEPDAP
jgi:hypothetical protein